MRRWMYLIFILLIAALLVLGVLLGCSLADRQAVSVPAWAPTSRPSASAPDFQAVTGKIATAVSAKFGEQLNALEARVDRSIHNYDAWVLRIDALARFVSENLGLLVLATVALLAVAGYVTLSWLGVGSGGCGRTARDEMTKR